jgi:superfamily II DNA or RNA helicase
MIDESLFKKKELYPFQDKVVKQIIEEILGNGQNFNLLFQLPTGGGKTVIFSNIAKQYVQKTGKKVLILTHRIELCVQTSKQLTALGVANKVVNSVVKLLEDQNEYQSFTAMVETLEQPLAGKPVSLKTLDW